MHRFFDSSIKKGIASLTLTGDDARHIQTVLRLGPGDEIIVCDGNRLDFHCVIRGSDAKKIQADVLSEAENSGEPPAQIILYQGLPKADKMEWIIQKSTELGITKLVPVITEFAIAKPSDRMDNKLIRWRKIAEAAAKQSGRGCIPSIDPPLPLNLAIRQMQALPCAIVAYEKEEQQSLKKILQTFRRQAMGICIGPEGGFSRAEIDAMTAAGIYSISLGKRILRTETAGPAVLAMIQYEWEALE